MESVNILESWKGSEYQEFHSLYPSQSKQCLRYMMKPKKWVSIRWDDCMQLILNPLWQGAFCPDLELLVDCTNYHQSLQNTSVLWKPRAIDPASQRSLYLTLSITYVSVISLTYVSQKILLWSRLSWLTLNFKFEIELPQHEICIEEDMVNSTELRQCGEEKAAWIQKLSLHKLSHIH